MEHRRPSTGVTVSDVMDRRPPSISVGDIMDRRLPATGANSPLRSKPFDFDALLSKHSDLCARKATESLKGTLVDLGKRLQAVEDRASAIEEEVRGIKGVIHNGGAGGSKPDTSGDSSSQSQKLDNLLTSVSSACGQPLEVLLGETGKIRIVLEVPTKSDKSSRTAPLSSSQRSTGTDRSTKSSSPASSQLWVGNVSDGSDTLGTPELQESDMEQSIVRPASDTNWNVPSPFLFKAPPIQKLQKQEDIAAVFGEVRHWVKTSKAQGEFERAWHQIGAAHRLAIFKLLSQESKHGMRQRQAKELLKILQTAHCAVIASGRDAAVSSSDEHPSVQLGNVVPLPSHFSLQNRRGDDSDHFQQIRQWIQFQEKCGSLRESGKSITPEHQEAVLELLQRVPERQPSLRARASEALTALNGAWPRPQREDEQVVPPRPPVDTQIFDTGNSVAHSEEVVATRPPTKMPRGLRCFACID